MKKSLQFITLLSTFSLLACTPNPENSSSNTEPSFSDEKSKNIYEINAFLKSLDGFEKDVRSFSYVSTQSDNYYAVTIDTKVEGLHSLFKCDGYDKFLDDTYKYYQGDEDPIDCEKQNYVKDGKLYMLNHYDDSETTDSKTVYFYDEEVYGPLFDLSFQSEERQILNDFMSYFDAKDKKTEQSFPQVNGNGTYSYSYGVATYREGVKTSATTYENKITIKENTIKEIERILKTDEYVKNEVINYSHSTVNRIYDYGELNPFDGTILNPDDFKS